ncbi:MAG: MopE-related protein [Sandaracinaceae bacterium]
MFRPPHRASSSLHLLATLALTVGVSSTGLFASGCDCAGDTPVSCDSNSDCEADQRCADGICMDNTESDGGTGEDDGGTTETCMDGDGDGADGNTIDCPSGTDCNDSDGTVSPSASEVCGDGTDNDCDGTTDEPDCDCETGDRLVCYEGDAATRGVGACRVGVTICVSPGMTDDCRGQVLPVEETCDGTDEDCDGQTDEGLRNACGVCSDVEPMEMCGNEIDDDCDGLTDEDCECDYRCMCAPSTSCDCEPPTNQPCYEGPFGTGGVGVCAGGRRDCLADAVSGGNRWGSCAGQVMPSTECDGDVADGNDDDCDGLVDEGCADADGDGSPFPLDCDDTDAEVNPGAAEVCNGRDDNCNGVPDEGVTNGCGTCDEVPDAETCDNGADDDCDGTVDEGCDCSSGATQACYGGPEGTSGVGACMGGTQTCEGTDEFPAWGACAGEVRPQPEFCDGLDNDCDGEADERWAAGSNACGWCDPTEICDGEDQDCDGMVDEGVANACGSCGDVPTETCDGVDNDCDGEFDEGVVNACGTCPPEPCFTETWGTPGDCEADGRFCDDVEEHPDYPGSVTLGESTLDFDYIYIAVTGRNQVAQLDTRPGATEGTKNWQVSSHGCTPSRTAVANDGSVWVTNRAIGGCNSGDLCLSNVVHLSETGTPICRAPVLNIARSVAIDGNGDIWAGSNGGSPPGRLYHISGTMVGPMDSCSTDPLPECVVLNTIETGVNIYGLTADPDGFIWTASSPSIRINIADYSQTTFTHPSYYGIAPDRANRIWHGGWIGGANVHSIDRTTGVVTDTGVGSVTAVTVHPDGSVWGSGYGGNFIVGYDPATSTEICRANIPGGGGGNPHGIAVDRAGRLWMPSRFGPSGNTSGAGVVNVFDTACNHVNTHTVDANQELYSYSDMTGHLLRTFVSPEGRWQQVFDSGYATPYWTQINWTSIEPPGTDIEVIGRTADTIADLDTGVACGPFNDETMPADLSSCPAGFQGHRYLRVETRLLRSGTDERPILRSIDAAWAY